MSASSTAFCASMKTTSPYALKAILFCRLDASTTVWPTISASNIAALRPRALPARTTATICGGATACQRNPVAAQRLPAQAQSRAARACGSFSTAAPATTP